MKNVIIATGRVRITQINLDTDERILIEDSKNLVVALGIDNCAKLLGGSVAGLPVTKFGVGTSGTAATSADTTLTTTFSKNIGTVSYPQNGWVQFTTVLTGSEANGLTLREAGLYFDTLTLFSRKVLGTPINKASGFAYSFDWIINFT